jgi:hypothetical protein
LFNATTPDAANDIYVSRRYNKTEDLPEDPSGGWQAPVNLGPNVNSTSADQSPWIFQDDTTGTTTLYFGSDRSGHFDIYSSTLQEDGTFTAATPVWELNNPDADDQHPTVSRDGLEMYFISNRSGSNLNPSGDPSPDIWVSIRSGTLERWGTPVNLDVANAARGGALINSDFHDGRPALSFDGTRLYFFSANRIGNESNRFDIWVTTREKLQGGRVKQPMVK